MTYDPQRHHRRSIRLRGYDYSQEGAYFITICVQDRRCLFGDIVRGEMRPNAAGQMVLAEWEALPTRFPTIELDAFIVMPNHLHGIILINVRAGLVPAPITPAPIAPAPIAPAPIAPAPIAPVGAGLVPAHSPTIGDVVGAFKSLTTGLYIRGAKQSGWPRFRGRLWQRNYFERIIRDETALNRIRQYILENPARWSRDRENPESVNLESDDE